MSQENIIDFMLHLGTTNLSVAGKQSNSSPRQFALNGD